MPEVQPGSAGGRRLLLLLWPQVVGRPPQGRQAAQRSRQRVQALRPQGASLGGLQERGMVGHLRDQNGRPGGPGALRTPSHQRRHQPDLRGDLGALEDGEVPGPGGEVAAGVPHDVAHLRRPDGGEDADAPDRGRPASGGRAGPEGPQPLPV